MVKIVQKDDEVLRKVAEEIKKEEFGSVTLGETLDNMRRALKTQEDGVALAAPQIGISKRIFIVSPKAFSEGEERQYVFINPVITKRSLDKKLMEEGCLSVRWWYGKIRRASRVTVKAQDETGKEFTMKGKGLIAQIFQHEIDHLDGILFTDNAKELQELKPKDEKRD